jgi:hypothetical protein
MGKQQYSNKQHKTTKKHQPTNKIGTVPPHGKNKKTQKNKTIFSTREIDKNKPKISTREIDKNNFDFTAYNKKRKGSKLEFVPTSKSIINKQIEVIDFLKQADTVHDMRPGSTNTRVEDSAMDPINNLFTNRILGDGNPLNIMVDNMKFNTLRSDGTYLNIDKNKYERDMEAYFEQMLGLYKDTLIKREKEDDFQNLIEEYTTKNKDGEKKPSGDIATEILRRNVGSFQLKIPDRTIFKNTNKHKGISYIGRLIKHFCFNPQTIKVLDSKSSNKKDSELSNKKIHFIIDAVAGNLKCIFQEFEKHDISRIVTALTNGDAAGGTTKEESTKGSSKCSKDKQFLAMNNKEIYFPYNNTSQTGYKIESQYFTAGIFDMYYEGNLAKGAKSEVNDSLTFNVKYLKSGKIYNVSHSHTSESESESKSKSKSNNFISGDGVPKISGYIGIIHQTDNIRTTKLDLNNGLLSPIIQGMWKDRIDKRDIIGFLLDYKRAGDYEQVNSTVYLKENSSIYPIFVTGDILCAIYARYKGLCCCLINNYNDTITIYRNDTSTKELTKNEQKELDEKMKEFKTMDTKCNELITQDLLLRNVIQINTAVFEDNSLIDRIGDNISDITKLIIKKTKKKTYNTNTVFNINAVFIKKLVKKRKRFEEIKDKIDGAKKTSHFIDIYRNRNTYLARLNYMHDAYKRIKAYIDKFDTDKSLKIIKEDFGKFNIEQEIKRLNSIKESITNLIAPLEYDDIKTINEIYTNLYLINNITSDGIKTTHEKYIEIIENMKEDEINYSHPHMFNYKPNVSNVKVIKYRHDEHKNIVKFNYPSDGDDMDNVTIIFVNNKLPDVIEEFADERKQFIYIDKIYEYGKYLDTFINRTIDTYINGTTFKRNIIDINDIIDSLNACNNCVFKNISNVDTKNPENIKKTINDIIVEIGTILTQLDQPNNVDPTTTTTTNTLQPDNNSTVDNYTTNTLQPDNNSTVDNYTTNTLQPDNNSIVDNTTTNTLQPDNEPSSESEVVYGGGGTKRKLYETETPSSADIYLDIGVLIYDLSNISIYMIQSMYSTIYPQKHLDKLKNDLVEYEKNKKKMEVENVDQIIHEHNTKYWNFKINNQQINIGIQQAFVKSENENLKPTEEGNTFKFFKTQILNDEEYKNDCNNKYNELSFIFNKSIEKIDLSHNDVDYSSIILLYYILNLTWDDATNKYIFDPILTNSNKYTNLLLKMSKNEDINTNENNKDIKHRDFKALKSTIAAINNKEEDVFKIEVVIFFAYINTLYSSKAGGEYFKLSYENKKIADTNMTFDNKSDIKDKLTILITSFFFNFTSTNERAKSLPQPSMRLNSEPLQNKTRKRYNSYNDSIHNETNKKNRFTGGYKTRYTKSNKNKKLKKIKKSKKIKKIKRSKKNKKIKKSKKIKKIKKIKKNNK